MVESAIRFPAVCFASGSAWIARGWPDIKTTTRQGLRSGKFDDLLVVDSEGVAVRFNGAVEIGKAKRPAWAPRLSFSKWIEVALHPAGSAEHITADALRSLSLRSFAEWHGWSAASDFARKKEAVEKASAAQEIVRALAT